MPSTQLISQSGGVALVSGDIWSGSISPPHAGIQLRLDSTAVGPVYVGVRRKAQPDSAPFSGHLSGSITITSGGGLSSGGLSDGLRLDVGDSLYIPKIALSSGIQDIRVAVPATSSGARLYWQEF